MHGRAVGRGAVEGDERAPQSSGASVLDEALRPRNSGDAGGDRQVDRAHGRDLRISGGEVTVEGNEHELGHTHRLSYDKKSRLAGDS